MVPFSKRSLAVGLGLAGLLGCDPVIVVEYPPIEPPVLEGASCPEGMVGVRGGLFAMSRQNGAMWLASFCIDLTEVTLDRYEACVRDGKCSAEHFYSYSPDGKSFFDEPRCNARSFRGDHPINCVDWEQARAFCSAHGDRLPTEEEWQWAAQNGERGTTFPWLLSKKERYDDPKYRLCGQGTPPREGTCAVGSFPSGDTPLGIHDLAGNVWEWTASKYDSHDQRVIRGGSWMLGDLGFMMATFRYGYAPTVRDSDLGFRCARSLP